MLTLVLVGAAWAKLLPIRPPCTPLNVVSPYQSVWSCTDELHGSSPTFWTGDVHALFGMIMVDGTSFRWMGPAGASGIDTPAVEQLGLPTVFPTRTLYQFQVPDTVS